MSRMLDIFEIVLNIFNFTFLRLDGSTKPDIRQKIVERFNNDTRIFCFISSTRSGGIGLNLTGANIVVFYDSDWNPAMDKQAQVHPFIQDRCHRIGQTRSVKIYRLILESTIEENILLKNIQKRKIDEYIMEEGKFDTESFEKVKLKDFLGGILPIPSTIEYASNFGEVNEKDNVEIEKVLEIVEEKDDIEAFKNAKNEENQQEIEGKADYEDICEARGIERIDVQSLPGIFQFGIRNNKQFEGQIQMDEKLINEPSLEEVNLSDSDEQSLSNFSKSSENEEFKNDLVILIIQTFEEAYKLYLNEQDFVKKNYILT